VMCSFQDCLQAPSRSWSAMQNSYKLACDLFHKILQFVFAVFANVRFMQGGADEGNKVPFDKEWLMRFIQRNTVLSVKEMDRDLETGDVKIKVMYRHMPWWQRLRRPKAETRKGKLRLLQITLSSDDAFNMIASVWRSCPGVDVHVAEKTPLNFKSSPPGNASKLTCSICRENVNGEGTGLLTIATLPCGDAFHAVCLTQWAQSGSANCRACPLCRCPY